MEDDEQKIVDLFNNLSAELRKILPLGDRMGNAAERWTACVDAHLKAAQDYAFMALKETEKNEMA